MFLHISAQGRLASALSSVDMNHATSGSRLEEFCLYILRLRAKCNGMSIMTLVVFRTGKSSCGTKTMNENLYEALQHYVLLALVYYALKLADILA